MFRIFTEPFMFLAFFSYGVYISIVPQLIVFKVCHSNYNLTICNELSTGRHKLEEESVYKEASKWNTICFVGIFVPSLFVIMLVGALADITSKRKMLLLPPLIITLQTMILILTAKFVTSSMIFVVLAASLTTVYGDIQGHMMLAYAYMADVTEINEDRTVRMNVLGVLVFIAIGLSSFLSGILLQNFGFIFALLPSLLASVANFIFVAFVLPEIPPREDSVKIDGENFKERLLNFCKLFKVSCLRSIAFLKKYLFSWKNKHIGLLLLTLFFTDSALTGENVVLVLFIIQRPLVMSAGEVGEFILALQCMSGVGVVVLVFVSAKLFKPSDACLILIGQISVISTYLAIGLSKDLKSAFAVTPLAIAFSLPLAGIKTMITKLVEPHEHATALSCVALVKIIDVLLITLACYDLFRVTATYFPGLSMIVLAISCFLGLLVAVLSFYCIRRRSSVRPTDGSERADSIS